MSAYGSFAVWITGLPSSGKSTIAAALVDALRSRGVFPVTLESDVLRKVLTPEPSYTPDERDRFYRQMAELGALIVRCGVPVIFDATANRRAYRDRARSIIPRFIEVAVTTPLDLCRMRDAKGLYDAAASGRTTSVPGIQAAYEPPFSPDASVDGSSPAPENARTIMSVIDARSFV